jgi:catalase-peroxidase
MNHTQWVPDGPTDAGDIGTAPEVIMLTADLALLEDQSYRDISMHFKDDLDSLTTHFNHAWYKLMSGDVGPVTRCRGPNVPPAQSFQWPLPDPLPVEELADFAAVSKSILEVMYTENADVLDMDPGGYGPLFVRLAWQCANPFRSTDNKGGCNGARIRNMPQSGWTANVAMDSAMDLLQPVKDMYGDSLSWADLIVLSGNIALSEANSVLYDSLSFTGGRVDAPAGEQPDLIADKLQVILNGGDQDDTIEEMMNMQAIWGLTFNEVVALIGGGHSLGRVHSSRSGFVDGQWTTNPNVLDTEFFHNLLNLEWTLINEDTDKMQYTSTASDGTTSLHMLRTDMNLRFSMEYRAVAEQYLGDQELFLADFSSAWTKVMNRDRFDLDTTVATSSDEDDELSRTSLVLIAGFGGGTLGVLITALAAYFLVHKQGPKDSMNAPLNAGAASSSSRSSEVPAVRPSEVADTL